MTNVSSMASTLIKVFGLGVLTLSVMSIGMCQIADSGAAQAEFDTDKIASGVRGNAIVVRTPGVKPRPGIPEPKPVGRPVADAVITLQVAGGGKELARATSDAAGKFEIRIKPGRYLLVPLSPAHHVETTAGTQTITVASGRFTSAEVVYRTPGM